VDYAVMLFLFIFVSVVKTKLKTIFAEFCSFETNSQIDMEFHTLLYLWFTDNKSSFLWQTVWRRN